MENSVHEKYQRHTEVCANGRWAILICCMVSAAYLLTRSLLLIERSEEREFQITFSSLYRPTTAHIPCDEQ